MIKSKVAMEVKIDFILIMNARKKHNITLSDFEVKTVWKKIPLWFSKESKGGKGGSLHIAYNLLFNIWSY